ncbi:MAG: CoA-binding protein [Sulfurovum sp.]|nr:CoA-binding protein [Sulfurovum sp.]
MNIDEQIEQFLGSEVFGVVGASNRRHKYGNKVLRCYLQNGRRAIPLNPVEKEIEGIEVIASVADLPVEVQSLSLITPPQVTEKVVEQAAAKGIKNIWMQPGAESPAAIEYCRKQGINLIADGSCVLVVLGYRE